MLRKLRNQKGFTLIELMVVIAVIGVLAAVGIPRFMGAQDRARIGAAEADLNSMRQCLGLYEIDHATFDLGSPSGYRDFKQALLDQYDKPYMELPDDTINFAWVSFAGDDTTYKITLKARDTDKTELIGEPEGVTINR